MTTNIEVRVGLKKGMADPEGANVKKALKLLGFDNVDAVESVKFYKITIDMDEKSALKEAEKMCQRLLANPVVHEYSITVAK
jgi:phosphoribosylformylglycinamidine synthase PurS subunit|tara:strand:- start:1343 stop:1588 length:246 start_codon:yes stop_codon:yes gene_type:complete